MKKTVKELIENILYAPNENKYYIANIDDLDEIKRTHEKELAEKDKLASGEAMLRINEYQKFKKGIDAKDKEYGILLADRDKLEMYRHNRLKKSDVEVKLKYDALIVSIELQMILKIAIVNVLVKRQKIIFVFMKKTLMQKMIVHVIKSEFGNMKFQTKNMKV